jgi:shikimate kinase
MGMTDKVWDSLTTVIKMNDKVVSLAGTVKEQQQKIEGLTERVIRLEATLELLLRTGTTTKQLRK